MAGMMGILTSALRMLPAEAAHKMTVRLLVLAGPVLGPPPADDPRLRVETLGLVFPNPLGLAAGFDKNAELPGVMFKFGFGFVECGTITPRPQKGNPRPRVFRLVQDRAIINRLGFNNCGMERAARRFASRKASGIAGINIGANSSSADRIADYAGAFKRLAPFASYIAVNVSSPNTPGLRGLQNRDELERLLGALAESRAQTNLKTPLLLKIAPDLDGAAMDDIASVSLAAGIEGLIISNTTLARPPDLKSKFKNETGGLSGAPLFAPSTAVLKAMRQRVGAKLVLIGVGGVGSGADAYAKIRAGATLVQLYTAFAYESPGLIPRIKRELLSLLMRDGFTRVSGAVGADAA
jgi:dihydroorotate dehydrogenase